MLHTIFLTLTITLALGGCVNQASAEEPAVVPVKNGPITLRLYKDATIRDVLFRLAKAAQRQTGQTATVEVASPMSYNIAPPLPKTSNTLSQWLRLLKIGLPSLGWFSDGPVTHVVFFAPRCYDPFSEKIDRNYTATMTVRQWSNWISDKLPSERIRIDDSGYGDQGRLSYSTYLQDQRVRLDVKKGASIRQFLTALAAGCGGTWTSDIQDPSSQPKHNGDPNGGYLAVRNYVYLFRSTDPLLSESHF